MKKSLISIAALGFLSIPALASSTTIQGGGKVIGPVLSHHIDVIVDTLSQRKLVEDDFVDVRPLIKDWVDALNLLDPAGISEHGVITEQLENLQAIGIDEKYVMIVDDFDDFRQSMIHTGLISRIRQYRDAILLNKPASLQPITDAITERQQNALPKDTRSAADAAAATEIAQELAKRVQGIPTKARRGDFNFLLEVINGQRMVQFIRVTMARRASSDLVSSVDFKHARNLISARNAAELQLYRDAGTETKRLNQATADVQAAAMQAGVSPAPFEWLSAVSVDMNLRRSIKFLERKAVTASYTATQFARLADLLVIRAQGPIGRSNLGRELSKALTTEIARIKQLGTKRPLVKDDFTTMERLRSRLLTNAAEATFKK